MKALVTGHLGFIGSHVYEHLLLHDMRLMDMIYHMIWVILKQIKSMM